MGTRCKVRVSDTSNKHIEFYHHWDGYPEGVGFELLELLNSFPIHKSAYSNEPPSVEIGLNTFIRALMKLEHGEQYEFDYYRHGDIEYFYYVNLKDRSIKCVQGYYEYTETDDGDVTSTFVIEDTHNVKEIYENFDKEKFS